MSLTPESPPVTKATQAVRRLKHSDYGSNQVRSKAFVEKQDPGLSLHAAVEIITTDRALAYCQAARYATPLGACLVPIHGLQSWFFDIEDKNEPVFGRYHMEMIPPARMDDDTKAILLASRATDEAKRNGLLREAEKRGRLKLFSDD